MLDSKVFKAISKLSGAERRRFAKFVVSPYHNASEKLSQIFDLIDYSLRNDSTTSISKEEVWSKINPNEPFNYGLLRKWYNDLLTLFEEFLVIEHLQVDKTRYVSDLFSAVLERKLDLLYNSVTSKSRETLDRYATMSAEHYYAKYYFERKYFELNEKNAALFGWVSDTQIQHISANLDYFFISEKLKYYLEVLSRKVLLSKEDPIFLMDEIIGYVKQKEFHDQPLIRIYYLVCLLYLEPSVEGYYHECRELLQQHKNGFHLYDIQELYAALLNYCVGQTNRGRNQFNEEYINLYDYLLKQDLLSEDGALSPWKFKNAVLAGLRSGQFAWVEQLLKNYGHLVAENQRENVLNYNSALLKFYQKKFNEVALYLRDVEQDDYMYTLSSKALLLSTYYELNDWEPLNYLLDSFKIYLHRAKKDLSEMQHESYVNLIKYMKRLAKFKFENLPIDLKFLEEIMENGKVSSKLWLIEKGRELVK
jgi:hypothetical protein